MDYRARHHITMTCRRIKIRMTISMYKSGLLNYEHTEPMERIAADVSRSIKFNL